MAWWQLLISTLREASRDERARPDPDDDLAPDSDLLGPDLQRVDVDLVLETCVRERAHATLIPCVRGGGHSLRFAACSRDEITFELPESRSALRLEPLSTCWLSFLWRDQPTGFLSQVLRSQERAPGAGGQIALRPPTQLASENLRSALRVSNLRDSELRVRVASERLSPRIATPLDLSFSGMLLEVAESGPSEFGVHEVVDLELSLAGQSAWLLGVVRRRNGRRLGIHFPETLRAGRIEPPADLEGIIRRLQQSGVHP
jgi:hypothetical protein